MNRPEAIDYLRCEYGWPTSRESTVRTSTEYDEAVKAKLASKKQQAARVREIIRDLGPDADLEQARKVASAEGLDIGISTFDLIRKELFPGVRGQPRPSAKPNPKSDCEGEVPVLHEQRREKAARIRAIVASLGPDVQHEQVANHLKEDGIEVSYYQFWDARNKVFPEMKYKHGSRRHQVDRPKEETTATEPAPKPPPKPAPSPMPRVKVKAAPPLPLPPPPVDVADPVAQLAAVQAVVGQVGGISRARHLLDCLERLLEG